MIQQYIVPENLSTFDYYKKLIPMYLQESFGFVDQYKIWYDLALTSKESAIIDPRPTTSFSGGRPAGTTVSNVVVTDDSISFTTSNWKALSADINMSIKTSATSTAFHLNVGEVYTLSSVITPKYFTTGSSDSTYYVKLVDENGSETKCYGGTTFMAKTSTYSLYFVMKTGLATGLELDAKISMKKIRQSSIISSMRDIFNSLNIFNKDDDGRSSNISTSSTDYLAFLNTIRESSTETEVIDKLAHLYGVSRNFSVQYSVSGTATTKELNLTDEALMLLIKCQVIKNAYKGTFEQLKELYSMIGLPVMIITEGLDESTGNYKNAHCRLILLRQTDTDYTGTGNPLLGVEDMFLAGLLTIQSLGIKYTYELYTAGTIAIFDSTDTNRVFDAGSFVR